MPRFEVRLEDPDSGHFRLTTINGPDLTKADAQAFCERREYAIAAYQYPGNLKEAPKAERLAHEQSKPYKVVSVKNVSGPNRNGKE